MLQTLQKEIIEVRIEDILFNNVMAFRFTLCSCSYCMHGCIYFLRNGGGPIRNF